MGFATRHYLVLCSAILVVGIAIAVLVGYKVFVQEAPAEWPTLIVDYSVTEAFTSVGDKSVTTTTLYRLIYNEPHHWRREVVSATPVQTRLGSFSRTGSNEEVKGNTVTEFETLGGETTTETIPDGEMYLPGPLFYPISFGDLEQLFGQRAVQVNTGVRVCYDNRCQDNAPGYKFTRGNGSYIYADDERGIPPMVGPDLATEVRITGAQQAVAR